MVCVKQGFSAVTGFAMRKFFGRKGDCLAYYAADLVVEADLERMLGKTLETVGALVAMISGGLLHLCITECSEKTLQQLNTLKENLEKKLPRLAKNLDKDYVECLLNTPSDIFPEEKKRRLASVVDQSVFSRKQTTQPELDETNVNISIVSDRTELK